MSRLLNVLVDILDVCHLKWKGGFKQKKMQFFFEILTLVGHFKDSSISSINDTSFVVGLNVLKNKTNFSIDLIKDNTWPMG